MNEHVHTSHMCTLPGYYRVVWRVFSSSFFATRSCFVLEVSTGLVTLFNGLVRVGLNVSLNVPSVNRNNKYAHIPKTGDGIG